MAGCEFQKCSSFHTENKLLSDLKTLFWLLPASAERSKEKKKKKRWLSLISRASLAPAGSYNACCRLKPPGARLTLIHSQLVPPTVTAAANQALSYLEARGLHTRGPNSGWKGDDDEGLRQGGRRESRQDGWGLGRPYASYVPAGFGIQHFHICKGRQKRDRASRNTISGVPFMSASFDLLLPSGSKSGEEEGKARRRLRRGIRSSFDSFSPSFFFFFFHLFVNPTAPRNTPGAFRTCDLTIHRSRQVETGTRPALSIVQVSRCRSPW